MKALATVTLVGLAYGKGGHGGHSDHLGGHHPKNSTNSDRHPHPPSGPRGPFRHPSGFVHRDQLGRPYYPGVRPEQQPFHRRQPKPYQGVQAEPDMASLLSAEPAPFLSYPLSKGPPRLDVKPAHPVKKNHTHLPTQIDTTHQPDLIHDNDHRRRLFAEDDELFVDEDDEFFFWNKNNTTHKPHKPVPKNHVKDPKVIKPAIWHDPRIYNRHPHPPPMNATRIPHHRNTTHIPHPRNATHIPHHVAHNRTRPFFPVPHHNRTIPQKLVAYEDEEFFAVEDNVLFDLKKLLADASKTVGDVKQKPKNYGELLNDAINIAKDIKRKDDFEDHDLWKHINKKDLPPGVATWDV